MSGSGYTPVDLDGSESGALGALPLDRSVAAAADGPAEPDDSALERLVDGSQASPLPASARSPHDSEGATPRGLQGLRASSSAQLGEDGLPAGTSGR